jgi:epoxyqueuosine reductase
VIERLQRWASSRGYRVVWGPLGAVDDARDEIAARRSRGELDEDFYREELEPLAADGVSRPGSAVVVVAVPRPAHRVRFRLEGGSIDALLPPTYVRYRATFEDVRQDLAREGLAGARVEHLGWPIKSVAARLGLVRYGRNNVTYVPGLGSYVQLCGFVTDAPLPVEAAAPPAEPALLDECASCGACLSACPTGAIEEDRVLLRAERCLTLANETAGAFAAWVPGWAHNCLIGCLLCQQACPVNAPLTIEDTGLGFSEDETRGLLDGSVAAKGRSENGVRLKLAWLGQPYAEPVIGRNLRALLESSKTAPRPRP